MEPAAPGGLDRSFGFTEWFRVGERERVQAAITGMRATGATRLRLPLSWAVYAEAEGVAWFDWLIPVLAAAFDLLPVLQHTPPALSQTGRPNSPPMRLDDYADFVASVLDRYGQHFTHVELWTAPNARHGWDGDEAAFCTMASAAAGLVRDRGWNAVLGGPAGFDAAWLDRMGQAGLLAKVAAIGYQGFPGTWDSAGSGWIGWDQHLAATRAVLDRYNPAAEQWITETGYATWRHDEARQAERFRSALAAPAARLYWSSWQDVPHTIAMADGVYRDPRAYALGVTDTEGRPKLLRRLLGQSGGLDTLASPRAVCKLPASPIVVIGGAGFIGCNLAAALAADGEDVLVYDNLSRPGVEGNLAWLQRSHPSRISMRHGDIRDQAALNEAVLGAKAVFHFASQVAVTTSLADPAHDFAVNALGTVQVLEAVRHHAPDAPVIFASTNKVYGDLGDVPLVLHDGHHVPQDASLRRFGISEARPLDFCTPYGCSKGAADQYVLDYAKSYGLRTAVLRMSCIYGPRQFGTEDQGWVAHFLIRALRGEPITLYGDGNQVRDILHVNDAVAAYRAVLARIGDVSGQAFNLGGGPDNAVSLTEVLDEIGHLGAPAPKLLREGWRTGDQLYFVADTRRLSQAIGWNPRIGWRAGLRDLAQWLGSELDVSLPDPLHAAPAPRMLTA